MTSTLPRGDTKRREVEAMFDRIAPRYDLVNRVMTFGLDRGWRRRTVRALGLAPGAHVLDVACGTGDLCDVLAARGYRGCGVDLSAGMLAAARTRVPLVRGDALMLPVAADAADGLVSGFGLRNFVDLEGFFVESARVLRPMGRIAVLETAEPANPVMRAGHRVWFRHVVPVLGGGLARDRAAYRYLPESGAYLPPRPALVELVRHAGFDDVDVETLGGGVVQLITGTRR